MQSLDKAYDTKAIFTPKAKGKLNGSIKQGSIMEELSLEKAKSLEELNRKFRIWLDEGYNSREHSSLKGQSPMQAYTGDRREFGLQRRRMP